MNVSVLYKAITPELPNLIEKYSPDSLTYAKNYYELNYTFLPTMIDRFVYYMIYLASYRMLESQFKSGFDKYNNPDILKQTLRINPNFLDFNFDQFKNEIHEYLLPYPDKLRFLTGLCVIATNELIILQHNLDNQYLYRSVFNTFNDVCLGVIS